MKNENEVSAAEKLAEEVTADFLARQEERRALERSWQLNLNFIAGNQYCDVNARGELFEERERYYWQERRVFNHIAPVVEMRCSKLGRIRPALSVTPATGEESDRHSARLASDILSSVCEECDIDGIISDATVWSETCGTAFYKIIWDGGAGAAVGKTADGSALNEGGVGISAVSPFEIYPYSLTEENLDAQPSIIHAKAVPVEDIYSIYGVKLEGRDLEDCSTGYISGVNPVLHGYELVIERYERPNEKFPDGRLTTVAGGKLLYDGTMPYVNGENGGRTYPFVKQISMTRAGCFFGVSVVERLIPLQRAYNAVKNRKHEFLNRISMGTVAVEDGSVDTDELIEDGLNPGKVLVYRQGAKPPEMLTLGSIPAGFSEEEDALLKEFAKVSGSGDLTETADGFAGVTSATGLQLIIEQDEARMEFSYQQIKRAMKAVGRHILRLYRQFATDVRLLKVSGANNALSIYYFKGSDISSDDVVLEADNDANLSPAQRRSIIYEILDRGLFSDADGKMRPSAKNKILSLLGYEVFAGERDLGELNLARAGEENLKLKTGYADVKDYDDHVTHITEHTAFLLTEQLGADAEKRICEHIDMHRRKNENSKKIEKEN